MATGTHPRTSATAEHIRTPAEPIAPKLLKRAEVCKRVGFSSSSLTNLINRHNFPKPIKIGFSARWKTEEVDRWVEEQSATARR
jgi:predicted DNA-binding transcriptional regulator AlpA